MKCSRTGGVSECVEGSRVRREGGGVEAGASAGRILDAGTPQRREDTATFYEGFPGALPHGVQHNSHTC